MESSLVEVKQEYVERESRHKENIKPISENIPYEVLSEKQKKVSQDISQLKLYKYDDCSVLRTVEFSCLFCHKSNIKITKLPLHLSQTCSKFVYHKCPAYAHCNFEGLRDDYEAHTEKCQFIEVECEKCKNDVMKQYLESHSCLELTKTVFEKCKRKVQVVKEKIRYKENERNLLKQMLGALIKEIRLHNDNIKGYVKKLDKIQEIRMTERYRSSHSPLNSKCTMCRSSVSYTKCIKCSKNMCNNCKQF